MTLTRAMAAAQEDHEEREDPQTSTSRKRARTSIHPIQRTGGRSTTTLRRIFELPPEIFNEIAMHLTPGDLLFLARSNKFFREIFMSRSSIKFWRSAFGNVQGLPPCPPYLCEPQYASLLFSKTCSECGARVLRRMDTHLLVKLCSPCRDNMVDEFEDVLELRNILPYSERIFPSKPGYIFLLRRDTKAFLREAQPITSNPGTALLDWFDAKRAYLEEREKFAAQIDAYLDKLEEERALEVLNLKNKRREEIENRLLEKGWSEEDMDFPRQTRDSWLEHVFQPKQLTDRIWTNIYPKLVRLLKANKAYHQEEERKSRLYARQTSVARIAWDIEETLPPMVRVTLHPQNQGQQTASEAIDVETWAEDYAFVLGLPFPDRSTVLSWRVAKDLVEPDVLVEEMEPELEARREDIKREVAKWQDGFLQKATDVWYQGRDQPISPDTEAAGSSETKRKPPRRAPTRRSARHSRSAPMNDSEMDINPHVPALPGCTVEFTKADGTTTTDILELPRNVQILLRADTVFASQKLLRFFPGILSDMSYSFALGNGVVLHSKDRSGLNPIKRDDIASAIARALLRRLGRPDATYAEMRALWRGFSCKRCAEGKPGFWEEIVRHFADEQSRWTLAQARISGLAHSSKPIFHNTHDLDSTTPCVDVLAPGVASELESSIEARYEWPTTCNICESVGVEALYNHHAESAVRSNMAEHLMSAHEIQEPVSGVHFKAVGSSGPMPDWFDSDSDQDD